MSLKIEFVRYRNMLLAAILEQGEKARSAAFLISHKGYYLIGGDSPRINGKTFYIRGQKKARDNQIARCSYNTVEQAKEALQGFKSAIEAYNVSLLAEQQKPTAASLSEQPQTPDIETVVVG